MPYGDFMDWRLLAAFFVTVVIALAHSALGERRLLRPLLNQFGDAGVAGWDEFSRLTLRFAWHLTSVLMLACAVILLTLAFLPVELVSILVLEILGALFIASAAITGSYSRGRHIAWPLFALVGGLCWWVAARHDGVVHFEATKPVIGLGVSTILMSLAAAHFWWAAIGTAGPKVVIPEKDGKPLFRPGRSVTAVVALALCAASLLVAERSLGTFGFIWPGVVSGGCWLLAALLIARAVGEFRYLGLFKSVRTTAFGQFDTVVYTPLCLLLGIAVVAISAA